jgi:hypothetical protein
MKTWQFQLLLGLAVVGATSLITVLVIFIASATDTSLPPYSIVTDGSHWGYVGKYGNLFTHWTTQTEAVRARDEARLEDDDKRWKVVEVKP